MTVAKATSVEYYMSGTGVASGMESYYLDAVREGEPPGVWLGAGAAALGLSGEIDAEDMETLYGQFVNPVTGEQFGFRPANRRSVQERIEAKLAAEPNATPERIEEIRRETRKQSNVIGWDATLAVPKSVTAAHTAAHRGELAATRSGDTQRSQAFAYIRTQIEDAISDANNAGLAEVEKVATARVAGGPGGATQWIGVKGLTVASFFQHTTRSIDPHLHVHNVILNRVMCDDGKVRSLDGEDLLAQQYGFSAIAARTLAESLVRRLGFEMRDRPDGAAKEIGLVPQDVIDHFSTRSVQVTKAMAPLVQEAQERLGRELTDVETSRLHREAQRSSRAGKSHEAPTASELNERWWVELLTQTGHDMTALGDRLLDVVGEHVAARQNAADAGTSASMGTDVDGVQWSPESVITQAIAKCSTRSATWGRSNLISELERHLPILGIDADQVPGLLDSLADQALASADVVQVGGIGTGIYAAPSDTVYASTGTLAAETALRRAAVHRGCASVPADEVSAWLDKNYPSIWPDQRAAVEGIASSDAAMTVLVGPAGTGKSYAAGALAAAWEELNDGQGRLIGLAESDAATLVLVDDGVSNARNVSKWLTIQDRLSEGSTHPEHTRWALSSRDMVMVDEASMVSTEHLEAIRDRVHAAGARLVLTGDPRQLDAVEAGGVMDLLDGHAETYTLTDVRRFAAPWERAASLALRDGDSEALAEYDRHGRILDYDSTDAATTAAARAAVADRFDGRSVIVVTPTNAQAAAVSAKVRDQLISLGVVHPDRGVTTGRDGNTASIGDIVICRHNAERTIGVTNRLQYQVIDTPAPTTNDTQAVTTTGAGAGADDEGWLLVRQVTAPGTPQPAPIRIPATYVRDHVQLGYASTVHSAQGLTVDSAHLVAGSGGRMDAAGLYVALSRGRYRNTAHVALNPPPDPSTAPAASTPKGGQVKFENSSTRDSARDVLETALTNDAQNAARSGKRPGDGVAATVAAERASAHENSMATITARLDAETRRICRARTERHLDDLVADGVLPQDIRARLSADQGTEHLSRLLRGAEQAGHDPRQVLTDAITTSSTRKKGLHDATSVAQVLSYRITRDRPHLQPLDNPTRDALIPTDVPAADTERLTELHQRAAARTDRLGELTAEQAPAWAVQSLGPVPDPSNTADRADWQHRAGLVAAHREAVGWAHPTQALGRMPGMSATERRISYAAGWDALGRPDTSLDETALSDGQLLNRITAWEREQEAAPPVADTQLRAAETAAETARQNAALAEAAARLAEQAGDQDEAGRLRADALTHREEATLKAAVAESYTEILEARKEWAAAAVGTREAAERALPEADRRGLEPGNEPDRTTADAWLDTHHQEQAAGDEYRPITETDVPQISDDDAQWALATSEPDNTTTHDVTDDTGAAGDELQPPVTARPTAASTTPAADASHELDASDDDNRRSLPTGHLDTDTTRPIDEDTTDQHVAADAGKSAAEDANPIDASTDAAEEAGRQAVAAVTAPKPPSAEMVELEAMTTSSSLALSRLADRVSQDSAHHRDDQETATYESLEAGRRRREAAELDPVAVRAATAERSLDDATGL